MTKISLSHIPPKIGDTAPLFTLPTHTGEQISLSQFHGKWVIVYFYPRDNTPGCTIEAKEFTKLKEEFEHVNAVILGVSTDSIHSHKKFCDAESLEITLLADEDHHVHEKYGVWREKQFMGKNYLGTIRSTFLISPEGKIAALWDQVKAEGHAQEVLRKIHTVINKL